MSTDKTAANMPAFAGGTNNNINLRLTEFWCDAPHA
jgi:hypothetical protein